ncbi:MAG: MFS transporter, partial [Actinobacteria bacterium]|nr:MFS transporter [Actinomycetota bacterium]
SGIGVAGAVPAGALLVLEVSGSESLSGLAQTFSVLGAALMAIPLASLTARGGRRLALSTGYVVGAMGATSAVLGGSFRILPLLLLGTMMVGAASAAGYQTRFAAVDLSSDEHRARDLSMVVWAGTVGAVAGPNLLDFSGSIATSLGMRELVGPYLFAGAMLLVGAVVIWSRLRPDPYLYSRREANDPVKRERGTTKRAFATIRASRPATIALAAIVVGHIAMVSIMVMTPVHMRHVDVSLKVIGLVISVHILGMYALSPVMGWLSDRYGRYSVIRLGVVLLLLSALVAGTAAADDAISLGIGLFLLGLGWSATIVAGSTLLAESLEASDRPAAQGASDLMMNGAGALGGVVAGIIIAVASYGVLCAVAAIPILLLGVATVRRAK